MVAGWSKEVFANNLKHYMESFGKNQVYLLQPVLYGLPQVAAKDPGVEKSE